MYTVFSVEHFKSGGDIKCGGCVRLTATREMEPDPGYKWVQNCDGVTLLILSISLLRHISGP